MSNPTLRPIRWGILSTGHIASVFARDLALLPEEAELGAVGSRDLTKAEAFADEYGIDRAYGSYPELAADPDLDVIYVASTHNDHFASASLCLQAGKAVLVEKPLTTTVAETEALIDLARDRKLFLMEALWTRTNPLIRQGVELVRSGAIGPIRHLDVSFGFAFDGEDSHRLLDPDQAGGAILDLGVYPVHLAQLFLGAPDQLLGTGSRGRTGVDVHAVATLSYRASDTRPNATASLVCSLVTDLPTHLEVSRRTRFAELRPVHPAHRADCRPVRPGRTGSVRHPVAGRRLHLPSPGGDAMPARRGARVATGRLDRHAGRRSDPGPVAGIRAPLRRTLGTLARVRWRGAIGSAPVL